MVTVTVSIDCLRFAAVIASSPQDAPGKPPYSPCCCTSQAGTPLGTKPVIELSDHVTPFMAWPAIVTYGQDLVSSPLLQSADGAAPKP